MRNEMSRPHNLGPPSPRGVGKLRVTTAPPAQLFIVASATQARDSSGVALEIYARIAAVLQESDAAIVHERAFGSLSAEPAVMAARREGLSTRGISVDSPVTYVAGCPPWGEGLAGAIVHAVASASTADDIWPVVCDGAVCGRGWRLSGTTFLALQNIHELVRGPATVNTRPLQVRRMFELANRILREQGASYRDVMRTWIYLDDFLGWYDEFNIEVRRRFDPAPTGI